MYETQRRNKVESKVPTSNPFSSCLQYATLPKLLIEFALHRSRQSMKDEYKRRRKVERPLIRTLPDVDSSDVFTPVHQEALGTDCAYVFNITTQRQEFIATSSSDWWLEVYGDSNDDSTAPFDVDSVSEVSDDTVIPNKTRKSLWRAVPRDAEIDLMGNIAFLAPDVIGLVQLETRPSAISTWNVRSGQFLESILLRRELAFHSLCKISDTEFVVGEADGHLFSFQHEGGCNLREKGHVWKAHAEYIYTISFHNGTILTASFDCTARLWDAETKNRLAVLYHDGKVFHSAISDRYIVTSSNYSASTWEKRELRIFRNSDGYPLTKILRAHDGMFAPTFLNDSLVLCVLRGCVDEESRPLVRNTLVVVDFEKEVMLARLKVGCRTIARCKALADGRILAIGQGGCRGVIATLPRDLRRLINLKTTEKRSKSGRRRLCTLM